MHVPAIEILGLSHRYPPARGRRRASADASDHPALNDITLSVAPGEVFGILGPNGSGKTTLFRILCTLVKPTSGRASIFGADLAADPAAVRRALGVVFQNPSLDGKLTARENLLHQGHLYGLRGADLRERIEAMLDFFALTERSDEPVERFSGGMKRKIELAKAVLHRPRLLLLDEPATGLDPGARRDVWRLLAALRQEQAMTIALTTHLMDEADRCERLAILHHGELVALDTPAKLKRRIGGDVITVEPKPGEAGIIEPGAAEALARDIEARFGPWDSDAKPTVLSGIIHLEAPDGPSLVPRLAEAFPGRIAHLSVGPPTLEDVFLHLTGHTLWGEG